MSLPEDTNYNDISLIFVPTRRQKLQLYLPHLLILLKYKMSKTTQMRTC
jgi:hypothetical protein